MNSFFKKVFIAVAPRNMLLTSRIADGVIVKGKNKAGYGGRGVFIKGINYEPELRHLSKFLSEGSIFIDVGANTGVYSMVAAKIVGSKGQVVSIEPFPETCAMLLKNVRANHYENVRVRTFGISDKTEARMLWLNRKKPNSFSFSIRVNQAEGLSLLTVSLDELYQWEKLDRVDYIKIDAEGEEDSVIKGAHHIIERYNPIIQVEISKKMPESIINGYTLFHAPSSINAVYVLTNSEKSEIANKLGWQVLKNQ